jgi:hypothetical protein
MRKNYHVADFTVHVQVQTLAMTQEMFDERINMLMFEFEMRVNRETQYRFHVTRKYPDSTSAASPAVGSESASGEG